MCVREQRSHRVMRAARLCRSRRSRTAMDTRAHTRRSPIAAVRGLQRRPLAKAPAARCTRLHSAAHRGERRATHSAIVTARTGRIPHCAAPARPTHAQRARATDAQRAGHTQDKEATQRCNTATLDGRQCTTRGAHGAMMVCAALCVMVRRPSSIHAKHPLSRSSHKARRVAVIS